MIQLVVTDVGHTLGDFSQPNTAGILGALSPMPEPVVQEEVRRVLHRAPVLTDDVIHDICDALLIPVTSWPESWPVRQFTAYDYTVPVLHDVVQVAPVVTLSNLAVTGGPERMQDLDRQCDGLLSALYTSYQFGYRKPAPWLWRYIADQRGCRIGNVVHVGDQWHHDVCGAVTAGARAILLTRGNAPSAVPSSLRDWPGHPDRIAIVDDLRHVPEVLAAWKLA